MNRVNCVFTRRHWFLKTCTYLKFSFCVLGVRNAHNLIISKLWKTLEEEDTGFWCYFGWWKHRRYSWSFLGKWCKNTKGPQWTCRERREAYIKVPESQNGDNHGGRGPASAVRAVKNEGWVRVLSQGTLHGLQQLIKVLRTRVHTEVMHKNTLKNSTTLSLHLT